MEIKLNKQDIINLIYENYSGITDVKVDDKTEIMLIVTDMNKFVKIKNTRQQLMNSEQTIPPKTLTIDEKNKKEFKSGGMISGGTKRSMIRM